jgi:uncharacterized protein involved in exopolysaccharide biosynthesis
MDTNTTETGGKRGDEDDEISLIDLFAVLLRYRTMIIALTVTAMIAAVVFSVISLALPPEVSPLPNVYSPQALMLINDSQSSSGGLSSMLSSSGLSGLASLAGISASAGSSFSSLAVYLLGTNSLLDSVVDEFGLIERYKIEKFPRAESRKALKKLLVGEIDTESGVFSLSFTDKDPAFARSVVNYCVNYLETRFDDLGLDKNKQEKINLEKNIENTFKEIQRLETEAHNLEFSVQRGGGLPSIALGLSRIQLELTAQKQVYSQLKVQYELIKVTMDSETPVFQILEYAEIPDQKSKPSRGLLCVIVTFAAGFLSVFIAFLRNAVENIRKDPEAMAKLRGGQSKRRPRARPGDFRGRG